MLVAWLQILSAQLHFRPAAVLCQPNDRTELSSSGAGNHHLLFLLQYSNDDCGGLGGLLRGGERARVSGGASLRQLPTTAGPTLCHFAAQQQRRRRLGVRWRRLSRSRLEVECAHDGGSVATDEQHASAATACGSGQSGDTGGEGGGRAQRWGVVAHAACLQFHCRHVATPCMNRQIEINVYSSLSTYLRRSI